MADMIRVRFKGDTEWLEVEANDFTLFCHNAGHKELEYDNLFPIDTHQTIYHGTRVVKLHKETKKYVLQMFPDMDEVDQERLFNIETREMQGTGSIHVLGLIDFTLKLIDSGVPFVWQYPESFLHPSIQSNIAQVAMDIQKNYVPVYNPIKELVGEDPNG